jgi:hypothetical protein
MIKHLLILLIILSMILLILFDSNIIFSALNGEFFDSLKNNNNDNGDDKTLIPGHGIGVGQMSGPVIMNNLDNGHNHMKCNPLSDSGQCGSGSGKCSPGSLYPIMDPRFNMREAAKQCLLLEDHLNNTKKRCYDCIRKHFLIIDGFLEEAVSLEKDNLIRDHYRKLFLDWVKIEKTFAQNPMDSDNLDNVSKNIRVFRKPLLEQYFDHVSEYND